MSWDALPLELVERVLFFCSGATFARAHRVCTTWLEAARNVERTCKDYWLRKCREEIPRALFSDLSSSSDPKTAFQQWFRGRRVTTWSAHVSASTCSLGEPARNRHHHVSSLALSGQLIVCGQMSGRVSLLATDHSLEPLPLAHHLAAVNDVAVVNAGARGQKFRYLSERFFSLHSHVVSAGDDGALFVALLGRARVKPFHVRAGRGRRFLRVRVHGLLLAAAAKPTNDVSLFRLDDHVTPDRPLRATHVTSVAPEDGLARDHWFGLFGLDKDEISLFYASDTDCLAFFDLHNNSRLARVHPLDHVLGDDHVTAVTGFAFGVSLYFFLSAVGRLFVSLDGQSVAPWPLSLTAGDHVLSLAFTGSVLAVVTRFGFLQVYFVPRLTTMHAQKKPVFVRKLSCEPLIKVAISDDGRAPLLVAATARHVFVVTWEGSGGEGVIEIS